MTNRKKQVHRLEDLEVEEVSIVDRAANKRRFLAVKSEGGEMEGKGAEIVKDDQGNLITNEEVQNEPQEQETQEVESSSSSTDQETSVFKSLETVVEKVEKRLSINPDIRREIFQSLGDTMGRLNAVMSSADMAQIDRGDKPSTLVPVLASELMEVSKSIMALSKLLGGVKKEDDSQDETKQFDFVSAISEIGAKLKELDSTPGETSSVEKSETTIKLEKAFVALTSKVTELTGIVKSQNKKLHELEQSRGQSNVLPVEKGEFGTREDEETEWPLDMNNEKTRETVDKAISFFDN